MLQQLLDGQANVLGYLAEQDGGNIPSRVDGYGGDPSIGMAKLLMRSTLSELYKAQRIEDRDDLPGLEDRDT